jgi:hypothetical protein
MHIAKQKKFVTVKFGETKEKQYSCKECKMTFPSKESLERHKNKSKHFQGWVYFGKGNS